MKRFTLTAIVAITIGTGLAQQYDNVIHDTEYYSSEAHNGEKWTANDKAVDVKLAEFKKIINGNPPNILYILIDDLGFGDMGNPTLNAIRGSVTGFVDKEADQSFTAPLPVSG